MKMKRLHCVEIYYFIQRRQYFIVFNDDYKFCHPLVSVPFVQRLLFECKDHDYNTELVQTKCASNITNNLLQIVLYNTFLNEIFQSSAKLYQTKIAVRWHCGHLFQCPSENYNNSSAASQDTLKNMKFCMYF